MHLHYYAADKARVYKVDKDILGLLADSKPVI